MYITVRTLDGKEFQLRDLSKKTLVRQLRRQIASAHPAAADVQRQRLFYRGKLLVDDHSLHDYGVQINDVVQLMLAQPSVEEADGRDESADADSAAVVAEDNEGDGEWEHSANSLGASVYEPGDCLDVRDPSLGAWFECRLLRVRQRAADDADDVAPAPDALPDVAPDDGRWYCAEFADDKELRVCVGSRHLRPRCRRRAPFARLVVGQRLLCNYNVDSPGELGFWYDAVVTEVGGAEASVTVYVGQQLVPVRWRLRRKDVAYQLAQLADADDGVKSLRQGVDFGEGDGKLRPTPAHCAHCADSPTAACTHCGCRVCASKQQQHRLLLCDECDAAYHTFCLDPPLAEVPSDDWYCPDCKRDTSVVVGAGQRLKESKRKRRRSGEAAEAPQSARDWGKGFACSGRSRTCTIVPVNHFGPIPSVDVGQSWLFRLQVSEAGVHRPPVSGISGRDQEGAYSIVLSGGYEDDVDNGEEFLYTGSGGRDLSGNRRTAEQSCDQQLTRMNRALARNVAAPIDEVKGADAGDDWRRGKPVRVVRNYKAARHSSYAPATGNRYDGIYKVVKYWPHVGKSGFRVWRFLMRRDDPVPAPWTEAGQLRMLQLGLRMEVPEGYEEAKENAAATAPAGKRRRSQQKQQQQQQQQSSASSAASSPEAKRRRPEFSLPPDIAAALAEDSANAKLWAEAAGVDGIQQFRSVVQQLFTCAICCDLVDEPATAACGHNSCVACLRRAVAAGAAACPVCRSQLPSTPLPVNVALRRALQLIFPGR